MAIDQMRIVYWFACCMFECICVCFVPFEVVGGFWLGRYIPGSKWGRYEVHLSNKNLSDSGSVQQDSPRRTVKNSPSKDPPPTFKFLSELDSPQEGAASKPILFMNNETEKKGVWQFGNSVVLQRANSRSLELTWHIYCTTGWKLPGAPTYTITWASDFLSLLFVGSIWEWRDAIKKAGSCKSGTKGG